MALSSEKQYYTFVKGLVTEASPLTFPENASLAEDNFVLERNGTRGRRLGLDYEAGYTLKNSTFNSTALADAKISFHRWDSPDGITTLSIGVIRVIDKLWFINLLADVPSSAYLNSGNSITIANLTSSEIDTAVINNKLVLVSEELPLPIVLSYNGDTDTITSTSISIKVRDFWGVNETVPDSERPTSLTNAHKYNLRNQNWSDTNIDTTGSTLGYYPSNSDIWYVARYSDPTTSIYNLYNPSALVRNNSFGARAPRGSAILDAFYRGSSRSVFSGISGLNSDIEEGAISTICAYAGRLFYSGVASRVTTGDDSSPNYSGYIFFSQVITSNDQLGKCHQVNDPTAEEISDVVDSDGGTIHIPDITRIVKLAPSKGSVLVFAENGIWEVFSSSKGFSATTYQLSKVSSTGVLSKNSVIEVNGTFLVWTNAGIFVILEDEITGRYKAENVSLNTIQHYYNTIPELGKANVKAFFSERENQVRWLYNDTPEYAQGNYLNHYNRELILDLTLQAFYTNSFSELEANSPKICEYISFPGYVVASADASIYAGVDEVQVTSTDQVVIEDSITSARGEQFGYLTFTGTLFTISKFTNSNFVDWSTAGNGTGANYESYLVTGYEIFGDASRKKQSPYIIFYFEKTESGFELDSNGNLQFSNPSSCMVQSQWNWTNSTLSNKWGTPFQAYRIHRTYTPTGESDTYNTGDRVITTKSKLRGSGKALSLKISAEAGKDLRLLGWSLAVTASQKI